MPSAQCVSAVSPKIRHASWNQGERSSIMKDLMTINSATLKCLRSIHSREAYTDLDTSTSFDCATDAYTIMFCSFTVESLNRQTSRDLLGKRKLKAHMTEPFNFCSACLSRLLP